MVEASRPGVKGRRSRRFQCTSALRLKADLLDPPHPLQARATVLADCVLSGHSRVLSYFGAVSGPRLVKSENRLKLKPILALTENSLFALVNADGDHAHSLFAAPRNIRASEDGS